MIMSKTTEERIDALEDAIVAMPLKERLVKAKRLREHAATLTDEGARKKILAIAAAMHRLKR